ncbi:Lsr2 family protein [Microbacterium lacticum]|uniref:Lsr2 dimerization domain-containing protein n=1 Tax=Microbacterium lacticum TaxID=33885 RepID=UPI003A888738
MAIKQMMMDDVDGTPIPEDAGGTVSFGFRGVSYEIDLTAENEEKLAAALAPFIDNAREVDHSQSAETPQAELDPAVLEVAERLVALDKERAVVLQQQAAENLAAGKKPYDTTDARRWLIERGIEFNQMGPLAKEFRTLYEEHYGLPSYDLAPKHPKR